MTKPLPLDTSANVTLDGSGNGQVFLGPQRAREHWQLDGAMVSVNTNAAEAQCSIYWGPVALPDHFLSQTATGSTGDTCGLGHRDMQPGDGILAKWTGGDPGSVATIRLLGMASIGPPA